MKQIFPIVFFMLINFCSCGQDKPLRKEKFNLPDSSLNRDGTYLEHWRGKNTLGQWVIMLSKKIDTNYKLRQAFLDKTYTQLFSEISYHKNQAEGPYKSYVDGVLSRSGFCYQGKIDGEERRYSSGKLIAKAYFREGKKFGTWEDFDNEGQVEKKRSYDTNGNSLETLYFKKGKLVRRIRYDGKGKVVEDTSINN